MYRGIWMGGGVPGIFVQIKKKMSSTYSTYILILQTVFISVTHMLELNEHGLLFICLDLNEEVTWT